MKQGSLWLDKTKIMIAALVAAIFLVSCTNGPATNVNNEDPQHSQRETDLLNFIELMQICGEYDFYRLCQKITREYGEEALPMLAEHVDSRSPEIRVGCIYTISLIYQQHKSQEALKYKDDIAAKLQDPVTRVQMEAASALCEMGDYRGVPILIAALRSPNVKFRWNASKVLFETFNLTFSYQYNDPSKANRERRADAWEKWWLENKDRYL